VTEVLCRGTQRSVIIIMEVAAGLVQALAAAGLDPRNSCNQA
jgi:hypothetical protein